MEKSILEVLNGQGGNYVFSSETIREAMEDMPPGEIKTSAADESDFVEMKICTPKDAPFPILTLVVGEESGNDMLYKMGASTAALDPEKGGRFLYGHSLKGKKRKQIIDHLIVHGVNHLILNSRNYARYADRLCHVFNGGQWMPEIAILHSGNPEWPDNCRRLEEIAEELTDHQLDFCILPVDALPDGNRYSAKVEKGILNINGIEIRMILVPEMKAVDDRLIHFMAEHPDVPFLFVEGLSETVTDVVENQKSDMEILRRYPVAALENLAKEVRSLGVRGMESPDAFRGLTYRHYKKQNDIYMLFNESADRTFDGTVTLQMCGPVYRYDAMKNTVSMVRDAVLFEDRTCQVELALPPHESVILLADDMAVDPVLEMLCT